jgi:hypothetical protein
MQALLQQHALPRFTLRRSQALAHIIEPFATSAATTGSRSLPLGSR